MSYFTNFYASWFTVRNVLLANGFTQVTKNKGVNCYVYFRKKEGRRTIRVQLLRSRQLWHPYLIEVADQAELDQSVFLGQIAAFKVTKKSR